MPDQIVRSVIEKIKGPDASNENLDNIFERIGRAHEDQMMDVERKRFIGSDGVVDYKGYGRHIVRYLNDFELNAIIVRMLNITHHPE